MSTPYIAVAGTGSASEEQRAVAEEAGAALGRAGAVVVCGGLGGVMEAACRGARSVGGTTVGLLPGSDRSAANPFIDVVIATGMGELRNGLVVRACDAVIAVGGEFGTLSEVALALKAGLPVVGVDTWTLAKPDGPIDAIRQAPDGTTAAELALRLAEGELA